MKTEVQNKIKILPLEECIESLSENEIEKLYANVVMKEKNKKITKKEKIEHIYNDVAFKYMASLLFLDSSEIKDLKEVVNDEKLNKINKKMIDNKYIFKIKNEYLVSEELRELIKKVDIQKVEEDKKNLIVNYYIISNGILKIERLQALVKESGLKLTKKEITEISKKYNYIIKNDVIYLNELAESLNEDNDIVELKESNEYKIVTFQEAMKMMIIIENTKVEEEIAKLLKKKVKNKNTLSGITEIIFTLILLSDEFEDLLEQALEDFEINLNEDDLDELYSLLEDVSHIIPSWDLNGYTPHEMYCDNLEEEFFDEFEDSFDCSFEDLSDEEKKEIYIFNYTMINGIIEIDKLIEILKEYHNLKTNKKEIIKIVKDNSVADETCIVDDYVCYTKFSKEDFKWILSLKRMDKYKVIEDMDVLVEELTKTEEDFEMVCYSYNLDEEITNELKGIMLLGILNEDTLLMTFENKKFNLSIKKQRNLYNDLRNIIKNTRMWIFNGYKPNELNNNNPKKVKVGRNDKCPCGSGKKYKLCCGK